MEGEPERLEESLGEQVSPIRCKRPGSEKGDGFSGGMKPLKRRCQACKGLTGKRKSGGSGIGRT